jgi:hypothetical protein
MPRELRRLAASSEEAFDAAISAVVMAARVEELKALPEEPGYAIEGKIWAPRDRATAGTAGRPPANRYGELGEAVPRVILAAGWSLSGHGRHTRRGEGQSWPGAFRATSEAHAQSRLGTSRLLRDSSISANLCPRAGPRRVRPHMTPVRDVARDPMPDAKAWWNRAAQEDARWYIATTSDPFFERCRRATDELVAFCGLQPSKDKTLPVWIWM